MQIIKMGFLVVMFLAAATGMGVELNEIVGKPKGSPYQATVNYFACMPTGQTPVTDWLNWGELGVWCDPKALESYYQEVAQRVEYRYPGLILPKRQSVFAERKPILSKLVALSTVMTHTILKERGLTWSPEETQAYAKATLAKMLQESFLSHYKRIDGKIYLMRGDYGHGHGLMQIDDRYHFTALFEQSVTWELLHNMAYGIDFFLEKWELVKSKAQQNQVSCLPQNDPDYYHKLSRSAYSLYNAGSFLKVCRWTDAADRWYQNDKNFETNYQTLKPENLQAYDWRTTLAAAQELVSDINIAGAFMASILPPLELQGAGELTANMGIQSPHLPGFPYCALRQSSTGQIFATCYPEQGGLYCENVIQTLQGFPAVTAVSSAQALASQFTFHPGNETQICNQAFPPDQHQLANPGEAVQIVVDRSRFLKPYDQKVDPKAPAGHIAIVLNRKFIDFERTNNYSAWYQILYQGTPAWVLAGTIGGGLSAYITKSSQTVQDLTNFPANKGWIKITTDSLPLWSGLGEGQVLEMVPGGQILQVQDIVMLSNSYNSTYLKVTYHCLEGYLYVGPIAEKRTMIQTLSSGESAREICAWQEKSLSNPIELPTASSPYDKTFVITAPASTKAMRLHFSALTTQQGYEIVQILSAQNQPIVLYHGDKGSDVWTPPLLGGSVKIRLAADWWSHGQVQIDKLTYLQYQLPVVTKEDLEEFNNGLGAWIPSPTKIGKVNGWVTVQNAGETAVRNSPTGNLLSYDWTLTRTFDLTKHTAANLDIKFDFKKLKYLFFRIMIGGAEARVLGDFTTLHEETAVTKVPKEMTLDLNPYLGKIVTVKLLLRKPHLVSENRIGLYVHRIGVKGYRQL